MSIFHAPKHLTYDERMDWYDRRIIICIWLFAVSATIGVAATIARSVIA